MSDFITHPFYKMHGAGNDFIMFDNRSGWMAPDAYEKFRKLCQLHTGIGADGLMLLSESDSADFKLDYFNADGYPGNMCGNGARCAVFLAHTLGIAPARCSFEINRVHYQAEVQQNRQVRLRMQMPEIVMESQELSSLLPGQFDMAYWVDTGVAHLVVKSNDPLEQVDVNKWGSYLRHHFGAGCGSRAPGTLLDCAARGTHSTSRRAHSECGHRGASCSNRCQCSFSSGYLLCYGIHRLVDVRVPIMAL